MHLVFDLDETLVATAEANRAAYKSLGVEPPANFHQIPWQDWTTAHLHDQKQERLPLYLKQKVYNKLLPCFRLFWHNTQISTILTNASDKSMETIVDCYPALRYHKDRIFNNMKPDQKFDWLLDNEGPGIYFDDNSSLIERIKQLRDVTKWQTVDVSEF